MYLYDIFSDRDGSMYTLCVGDFVTFRIATDRRDQTQRAINISLDLERTKKQNGEIRECGVVAAVKGFYYFSLG